MMAAMLTQVPLPWLPAGAEEIAPGVGVVAGDGGGVVWVHGLATFAWDGRDEAARRLAAVQLVRLRAAPPRQDPGRVGGRPGMGRPGGWRRCSWCVCARPPRGRSRRRSGPTR